MNFFNHYKTLVISDVPLGASPENFKKLIYFIKNTSCDKLILSGDIVKGWKSKKIGNLYKLQNKFLKTLLKISERDNTEIIFVTGDEWSYKENFGSFKFSNFSFVKDYRFKSGGHTFEVLPGDLTDSINQKRFGFQLNSLKYNYLYWLNKKYNSHRINQGKEYYSLIKWFSAIIPKELNIDRSLDEYKSDLLDLSLKNNCDGIISSHQACSGIYHFGGVTFLNSGYWTETLTALAESNYGKWEIIDFDKVVNDVIEALQHSDHIEELFEAEKNMIPLSTDNLTVT